MAMVAGTIMVINDGMPSYLVVRENDGIEAKFLNVEYEKPDDTTPLGTLLSVMSNTFNIDYLRLDELAIIEANGKIGSLYVFQTVKPISLPMDSSFKFVEASKLHHLLETVDMSGAPMFA